MFKRFLRRQDGFTLIELLVVILIIGILLAVALPSLLGQTSKANVSAMKQRINTVYIAAKSTATEGSGLYPGTEESLDEKIIESEPELGTVLCNSTKELEWEAKVNGSKVKYKVAKCSGAEGVPGSGQISVVGTAFGKSDPFIAEGKVADGSETVVKFNSDTSKYECVGGNDKCE